MKYLSETLKKGTEIAGTQKKLEMALGLGDGTITEVKAGRRGLPLEACYKLADITGANVARLVADNATVTEKKPEAVAYWRKKLEALERLAACIVIGSVTNFVTPSPAKAAPVLKTTPELCILCQILRRIMQRLKETFDGFAGTHPTTDALPACCPG